MLVESARVSFSFAFLLPVGVKKGANNRERERGRVPGEGETWMIFARVRSGFPMLIFIVKRAIESVLHVLRTDFVKPPPDGSFDEFPDERKSWNDPTARRKNELMTRLK